MTLWQLKVFSTVAKTGSFTKAAKILQITQPSATTLVQTLSREVGVKLFEKLGAKTHITSAGEEALRYAHQILGKEEEFRERMEELNGLKKGRLSVGAAPIAAASFLSTVMQDFRAKYPDIKATLQIQKTEDIEKQLLEGKLDVGFLGWPTKTLALISQPCHQEEICVIAPRKHPLTRKRSVSLEDLSKEALIAPERGIPTRELIEQRFADEKIPFRPCTEIGTLFGIRDAIRGAVASGVGIGFIAKCHVVGDLKAGRIKLLNVPNLNLKRTTYFAVHKKRQDSPAIQAFKNLLKST
jgi:DNA-binding transcriptional LysR family regulator